jgi:hypothetical protein
METLLVREGNNDTYRSPTLTISSRTDQIETISTLQVDEFSTTISLGNQVQKGVDDCNYVRHSPGHKLEREPLRGVCGSYMRQSWNVEMTSSLKRGLRTTPDDSPV